MGIVCSLCGGVDTFEMETGVWFCRNCRQVAYISDTSGIVPNFDIEDYIDDELC